MLFPKHAKGACNKLIRPLICCCLNLFLMTSLASARDGYELLNDCKYLVNRTGRKSPYSGYYCAGVIDGVTCQMKLEAAVFKFPYCIPEGVSLGQYAEITVKYMEEHLELLQTGPQLVSQAMLEFFACKEAKTNNRKN